MITTGLAYDRRYADAFWAFERVSNERFYVADIVNRHLFERFNRLRTHTLIDIGAGYGSLGELLLPQLRDQIAIEPNRYVRRRMSEHYRLVIPYRYNPQRDIIPPGSMVLLSQSLYFFPKLNRRRMLANLVASLDEDSVLCVVTDAFSGRFGHFLVRWLNRFGISEQIVLPRELFDLLTGVVGAEVVFHRVRSRLFSRNFSQFSQAISVYFDVVDPAWWISNEAYRHDLGQFRQYSSFIAENMLYVWLVRRIQP